MLKKISSLLIILSILISGCVSNNSQQSKIVSSDEKKAEYIKFFFSDNSLTYWLINEALNISGVKFLIDGKEVGIISGIDTSDILTASLKLSPIN